MQNTTIENVYRQNLKEKILQVATVLFYRHGIRQVRMDDISNNLRISKRTLYEIYDNKEVLLLGVLQHNSEKEHQSMQNFDKSGANVISIILEFYRLRMKELSRMSPLFFEDIFKVDTSKGWGYLFYGFTEFVRVFFSYFYVKDINTTINFEE